jgi:hypothetical protein
VRQESAAVLARGVQGPTRALYERLASIDEQPEEDLIEPLQALMEIGLESGRIREVYGAHAEMAGNRLYSRMPRARIYRQSVEAVNQALNSIEGEEIGRISIAPRGPGACSLTVEAGSRRITIRITRAGLSIDSVEATL